ncbi:MAG TPA: CopG family transcriptional regulator [Anaerolineae bacterium]|nr:CopG family transcriptional regulator [Anaerolineae bacterium]
MAENMIRMQVYLPRGTYERLQKRAKEHDLTLALQIREALESYLEQIEAKQDDGVLRADDPIFKMIGMFDSGLGDLSVNHDHYLYGWPKREEVEAMHEKPAKRYKTKKTAKRKAK